MLLLCIIKFNNPQIHFENMSKQENRNGLTLLFRVHARCMNLSVDINTSTLCYKVMQEQDMTGRAVMVVSDKTGRKNMWFDRFDQ